MDDFEMEHVASSADLTNEIGDCVMAELPYSIEEDSTLGRHLVAQRNLEKGELILCEKPIGRINKTFHDCRLVYSKYEIG